MKVNQGRKQTPHDLFRQRFRKLRQRRQPRQQFATTTVFLNHDIEIPCLEQLVESDNVGVADGSEDGDFAEELLDVADGGKVVFSVRARSAFNIRAKVFGRPNASVDWSSPKNLYRVRVTR